MKVKIPKNQDFFAGMIFVFFGVFAMVMSRSYPMGTASRMGAGYFPFLLGGLIAVLGLVVMVRPLWTKVEVVKPFAIRAMVMVILGILIFAALIDLVGLVLSLIVLVVITSLSSKELRFREVIVLAVVLTAMAVGLFVFGLNMPFPLFWSD